MSTTLQSTTRNNTYDNTPQHANYDNTNVLETDVMTMVSVGVHLSPSVGVYTSLPLWASIASLSLPPLSPLLLPPFPQVMGCTKKCINYYFIVLSVVSISPYMDIFID